MDLYKGVIYSYLFIHFIFINTLHLYWYTVSWLLQTRLYKVCSRLMCWHSTVEVGRHGSVGDRSSLSLQSPPYCCCVLSAARTAHGGAATTLCMFRVTHCRYRATNQRPALNHLTAVSPIPRPQKIVPAAAGRPEPPGAQARQGFPTLR